MELSLLVFLGAFLGTASTDSQRVVVDPYVDFVSIHTGQVHRHFKRLIGFGNIHCGVH